MWVPLLGLKVGTFGVRSWVALGVLLGSLRVLLRRLGSHLGCSWGELGVPVGCSEVLLCVAWVLLGALGPPRGLAEEALAGPGVLWEDGRAWKSSRRERKNRKMKKKSARNPPKERKRETPLPVERPGGQGGGLGCLGPPLGRPWEALGAQKLC